LLEAFSKIDRDDISLKIWGQVTINSYSETVMKKIKEDSRVEYKGPFTHKDLPEIYSQIDIAILPSLMENYPLGVFEAFHYKKPIIASNAGGIPEIIKNRENGLLFQFDSVNDLADKIKFSLNNLDEIRGYVNNYQPIKTIKEDALDMICKYENLLNK